jgi:hypothetical protein
MMGSMAAFVVCFLVSLVAIFRTIVELRQRQIWGIGVGFPYGWDRFP